VDVVLPRVRGRATARRPGAPEAIRQGYATIEGQCSVAARSG
jgi:hypothetical protein